MESNQINVEITEVEPETPQDNQLTLQSTNSANLNGPTPMGESQWAGRETIHNVSKAEFQPDLDESHYYEESKEELRYLVIPQLSKSVEAIADHRKELKRSRDGLYEEILKRHEKAASSSALSEQDIPELPIVNHEHTQVMVPVNPAVR